MVAKHLIVDLKGIWQRLTLQSVRLGIAATLGIAFAAVAALAVAANLLAEHGLSMIRTTEIAAVTVQQATVALSPVTPAVIEPAPRQSIKQLDAFLAAIDQFHRAAEAAGSNTTQDSMQLQVAAATVEREFSALLPQSADVLDQRQLRRLIATFKTFKESGLQLVALADQRKIWLSQYVTGYEAMHGRARASIDSAWKIFGRLVARQSLIRLSQNIEELGKHIAALSLSGGADGANLAAISAAESVIVATLQDNARGFTSSQGEAWVAQMRGDLAQLSTTRELLRSSDSARRGSMEKLTQSGSSLTTMLRGIQAATKASDAMPSLATQPAEAALALVNAAVPLAPVAGQRSVTTTFVPGEDGRRRLIAWVSGSVLLLLVIISVLTVRSIVAPVRRLLRVTARLAEGELTARVPPGGIKELDTLAGAFNQMAERLAAADQIARHQQQLLEDKVQERTEQLQRLADNDSLTALPNRRQLSVLLDDALAHAAEGNSLVGVCFIDIDNFKHINDGMGHAFGDRVLQAMAQRLQEAAAPFGFAARLGGDEFTVVFPRAATEAEIREAGWKLVRAFQKPLSLDGRDLAVSISVGASVYPLHEREAEALLRAADIALFRAKALGRSQLNMFSPALLESAARKFATEQGLRLALDTGEFELVFQPEINLQTMEVGLVEALIRWRQADGRLATPGEFLGVAEESGLIMEISDWVLRSAIQTASRWHHGVWPQACVAINVSSRQLIDAHFVERVKALLAEFDLPSRCVEIELTETVLQTGPGTLEALQQLRAHGIAIALDDFGTGYSSLASLQQLPLTRIKLDRSLINEIDTSARSSAIARSVIALSHDLGLAITAEGIERPEQLAVLMSQGDIHAQGYLLAKPLGEDEVMAAIAGLPERARSVLVPLALTIQAALPETPRRTPQKRADRRLAG